jgi:hypothetical protein
MDRRASSLIGHSPPRWLRPRAEAFLLLACLGAVTVFTPYPAGAVDSAVVTAANALTLSPLYVGEPATSVVNQAAVLGSLTPQIRIAVLPAGAGQPTALASEIGHALDPRGISRLTVGVAVGSEFGAASSAYCAGYAGQQAAAAVTEHETQLAAGGGHPDLTSLIEDFARRAQTGPPVHTNVCIGVAMANAASTGTRFRWLIWAAVAILLLVVAGGAGLVLAGVRRRHGQLAAARAAAATECDRLGDQLAALVAHDMNALSVDGNDPRQARQSLADATDRLDAARAIRGQAASIDDYLQARGAALEGQYAARAARVARGMDAGPEPPLIGRPRGEQLSEVRGIVVGGETYQGYPSYTPGASYYYRGGSDVPGGWYCSPFWETMPVGSLLPAGFGDGEDGDFGTGLGDKDSSDGSDSEQRS